MQKTKQRRKRFERGRGGGLLPQLDFILFIWFNSGKNLEKRWGWRCVLMYVVRQFQRLVKWCAVGDSCELSWINSPSLTLFSKAAKPVHSDNGRCSALELCWFIAGGISITALATGGEKEEEKVAREGWRGGRKKSSTYTKSLPSVLRHNMWVTSGRRGRGERVELRVYERKIDGVRTMERKFSRLTLSYTHKVNYCKTIA